MNNAELYHPSWRPDHCPSHNCLYHLGSRGKWRYKRAGYYLRKSDGKRIRRFRCLHCGVNFSVQSFSTTYYLKKPDIQPRLLFMVVGGMCNSQIADALGVAPSTIDRQIYHLGRHCLLYHLEMMKNRPRLEELVLDSFVTFEHSQYHPFHLHLAVDKRSSFMPYFTDSEVRRSGRMTAAQKRRREQLEALRGRPDPRAVRKDVTELLKYLCRNVGQLTLHTDEHREYPLAIRELKCRIRHIVTSSQERRDYRNRLFEINLLDLLLRHADAAHKRETIAYVKRRQSAALRLAIFLVWKNYIRWKRKRKCKWTPAMEVGLCQRPLTVVELLGRRLFAEQIGLEGRWRQYYWGEVETRAQKVNRRHELKYAR